MSKPANPLSKYRSHSYYHVLAICDSTDTAEKLSDSTSLDVWQHSKGSSNDQYGLGEMGVKSIAGAGNYCILINGSTDASFSISRASWNSVTNGAAVKNDKNTSIAMEGSIDISEPRGVVFLDRVVGCCIQMGIDSSNAVWVIKTFFVGYTDTDTTEYITDIQPIMFLALDVTGSFTEQGGLYNIVFVSIAYGMSRLPQYSKSGAAVNFQVKSTLKDTLTELTKVVQNNYDKYYNCVKDTVESMGNEELLKSLQRTTYTIEAYEPYDSDEYKIEDQLAQASANGDPCATKTTARIDANSSIEDGIHAIMAMCQKVKDEKAKEDNNHLKYDYKIHPTPRTYYNNDGTISYTMNYIIKRQVVHTSVSIQQLLSGTVPNMTASLAAETLTNNLIEFDYIYTGHNIDILEFDMKLSAGIAYLQIATSVNSYNNSFGNQPSVIHSVSTQSLNNLAARQGAKNHNIPVTFGTIIKNPINRNSKDGETTTQAAYTMAKHASLEVSQVSCKIIGNPRLLNSVNKNSRPRQTMKNQIDAPSSSEDMAPGWGNTPVIAKINIKMPRNNDDASLFMGTAQTSSGVGGSYAVDFWFNGYYNLMEIEHVFDGGEFTQTLNLLGIPDTSALDVITNSNNGQVAVASCFDNKIGCNNSQNKPPVAVPEKLPSMDNTTIPSLSTLANQSPGIAPNNASLINSAANPSVDTLSGFTGSLSSTNQAISGIISGNGNLNDIKGYTKASPEVKSAIDNAATKTNLTPSETFLLANMIATESSFNPSAKNPNSSATGLGQFVTGTWKIYGQGDPRDPNASALATAKYMKDIQSQLTKKLGRPPTNQEIYLGHKEGIGGATRILTNPRDGDSQRQATAYYDLQKTVNGSVPYVPNSIMYSNTDIPDIVQASRLNKDVIAASKNCKVEEDAKNDPNKGNCAQQAATAPTTTPTPTA